MKTIRARLAAFLVGFGFVASGVVVAATFNLFQPATGILKGNASTYVTTAAASSDVISLWSGTCNASTFLKGDGSCAAPPAGVTGANPTATIGLTATNGSAGTFMRSDAAPALSQSITPTWTGQHSFTATPNISGVTPQLSVRETDGGTDAKNWLLRADVGSLVLATATDAAPLSFANAAVQISRSGTTVGTVDINGTGVNLNAPVVASGQLQSTSTGAASNNSGLYLNAAAPYMRWRESDQVADARDWVFGSANGNLQLGAAADADTGSATAGRILTAARSGSSVSSITFGNTASNPSYIWSGSGSWNVGGGTGTAGQVLTSNGSGAAPSWQPAAGGGGDATLAGTQTFTGVNTFSPGATAGVVVFNSTAAGGPYVTFQRSATAFGDIGNGGQMGGGFTTDALALQARSGNRIQMSAGASTTPQFQIDTTGTSIFGGVAGVSRKAAFISGDSVGDNWFGFYEDVALTTRKGYIGYGNSAVDVLQIYNEESGADIAINTTGSGNVTVNNRPVVTSSTGTVKVAFLRSGGIGSCNTTNSSGFSACSRTAAGSYNLTFTASFFGTTPACTATSGDTSIPLAVASEGGTTNVNVSTYPPGGSTAADASNIKVVCVGN